MTIKVGDIVRVGVTTIETVAWYGELQKVLCVRDVYIDTEERVSLPGSKSQASFITEDRARNLDKNDGIWCQRYVYMKLQEELSIPIPYIDPITLID